MLYVFRTNKEDSDNRTELTVLLLSCNLIIEKAVLYGESHFSLLSPVAGGEL